MNSDIDSAEPRLVPPKQLTDLASEWDRIAPLRDIQLRSHIDASFDDVLAPAIFSLADGANWNAVVDCGCGTGTLTALMAVRAESIVGIDVSDCSIAIARQNCIKVPNVQFECVSVEEYAKANSAAAFTLAVANMMLMDTPDLLACLRAIAMLLVERGSLVFTITHPCFWPAYWGYRDKGWFVYEAEQFIEAPFRIGRAMDTTLVTTHIHRPLSTYINALNTAGFAIDEVLELPRSHIGGAGKEAANTPRFLAVRCHQLPDRSDL